MALRNYLEDKELQEKVQEIQPLRAGFDLIAEHVVITDPHGNILYMNKAAEQHTGYSFEESVGKNPGDLWGGHMPETLYQEMWETIKDKKSHWVGEVKNHNKSGEEYWQEVHINPVFDDSGEVTAYIGVEPDITARKNMESEDQAEHEKIFTFLVSRELKMIELKERITNLAPA